MLGTLLLYACADLSPRYGSVSVTVGDTIVFFKRESSGLNYDVVHLSASPSLEDLRGAKGDYVDSDYAAETLYFRVAAAELHVFTGGTLYEPKTGAFPVRVVVHHLTPLEWADLRKHPEKYGATVLDVPLH